MRYFFIVALFASLALASLGGCRSKRAKSCISMGTKAIKSKNKAEIEAAYIKCDSSCTHDKHEDVCKLKEELRKLAGYKKR